MSPHKLEGFVVDPSLGILASWRVLLGKSALEKAGVFSEVNGLQLLLLYKLPYSMKCLPTILPI